MLAYLYTLAVDKESGAYFCVDVGNLLAEEVTVIPLDEADFHTFASFGFCFEAFFFQVFSHFLFGVVAQREKETAEYLLRQSPEEVGLV